MRHVTNDERRARLARRHAIAPDYRVGSVQSACAAVGVLHATEPATVYLSVMARCAAQVADIDDALYRQRSLVRQLAMRRTLFVFPRDLLPSAWSSASYRTLIGEHKKLLKDLSTEPSVGDAEDWLQSARSAVLGVLADGRSRSAVELRAAVPELDLRTTPAVAGKWGRPVPIGPRVLTWLGAGAELIRGDNDGHWRTSRPRWTLRDQWLGPLASTEPGPSLAEGYAELVRVWLSRFGPGTEVDIAWWLGATKGATRAALADVGAIEVSLDGGGRGWLLPDDLEPEPPVEPWAALLPVLDPTTMGWKERDFYLDPGLTPYLFDSNGNGGTTAWVNGRVVGCWVQDEDSRVQVKTHTSLSRAERSLLEVEAHRFTDWLGGVRIASVYKSRLMKGEPLP